VNVPDIALGNKGATGRFGFVRDPVTHDVVFDDTEAHAVVTASVEERGSWAFDPTHGSDLHELVSVTSRTPSQAEAMESDALDALVRQNVIEADPAISATVRRGDANSLELDVAWTTPGGLKSSQKVTV
jgi:hypothetical protein